MNFDELTDQDIADLIAMPKKVKNRSVRWKSESGYVRRNHHAQGNGYSFQIYERLSRLHGNSFSCGLIVIKPDGKKLTLLRYNGKNHIHINPNGDRIVDNCHIHRATHKAIVNRPKVKVDAYAVQSDNYHSLNGALKCLVEDAAISGLPNIEREVFD